MRRTLPLLALLAILLSPAALRAQLNLSGVVNTYAQVTAYDSCGSNVTVNPVAGFAAGDRVLLIQMKGATIDTSNTGAFGTVLNYGNAGNFEFFTVDSVSGNAVYFRNKPGRSYSVSGGMQLIKVASGATGTVTGLVTAPAWNGTIGGVVVIELSGALTLNADIDVSGLGFRGGDSSLQDGSSGCVNYKYPIAGGNGAEKGESILSYGVNWAAGRGPLASGGGGGNCHNSGGGGGGNGGLGGIGGRDINSIAVGGIGGNTLNTLGGNRAFFGGGGGGGHQNNHVGTRGGPGGGIIIIRAGSVVSANRFMRANGSSNGVTAGQDGAGGGGAGGSILIEAPALVGPLGLLSNGGDGGLVNTIPCHGPGGGGGGGVIQTSLVGFPGNVATQVDSGLAGFVVGGPCGTHGSADGRKGVVTGGLRTMQSNTGLPSYGISPDTSICRGSSITLTAFGGVSYRWTPTTGLSNPNIASPVASPSVTTLYSVVITDASGCTFNRQVNLQVRPDPLPVTFPSGVVKLCPGDSVPLTASAGFVSYRWSTGATTRSITVKTQGTYSVIATDAMGCSGASIPVTVVFYTLTSPRLTTNGPTTFCPGDSVMISAPAGFASYTWTSGQTTRSIFAKTTGSYWALVVDTAGCRLRTDTINTVVRPAPSFKMTVGGPTTFCLGDSVRLSAPVGYAAYRWSTGATTRQLTVKTTGNYWVDATDNFGCTGRSDTTAVATLQPPQVLITANGPTTFCQGDSVQLFAPPGFVSYIWSNGGTGASVWVNVTGLYSVRATDAQGCSGVSNILPITVKPAPFPRITANGPTTFCFGDSVTLSAPAGYVSYVWSNGDITPQTRVGLAGNYTVTVQDTTGCSGTSPQVVVTVHPQVPKPILTLSGSPTICQGDSLTITAPTGYVGYTWSNGKTGLAITVKTAGNYWVTVSDKFGCTSISDTVAAAIATPPVRPTITAFGPTTFCGGDSVQLLATPGYPRYLWSNGDTTQWTFAKTGGIYTVKVFDPSGCSNVSAGMKVTSFPRPKFKLRAMGPTTFCDGDTLRLVAPTGYASYAWSTGETTRAIDVTTNGSYWVAVTNSIGCPGESDTVAVTVHPAVPTPVVTLSGATTFCQGDSLVLVAPPGYSSYYWSNGSTRDSTMIRTSGKYTVTVTDTNGCRGTSMPINVTVHASPRPVISSSGPTTICQGDSVGLSVPPGYTSYLWSTGETTRSIYADSAATYTVSVTDSNGCAGTAKGVTVITNPLPAKPTITVNGPTQFCSGDSTLLSAPIGFPKYLWSTGETTPAIYAHSSGSYMVTVFNGYGCGTLSDSVAVSVWAPPAKPVVSASGPTEFCQGDSVQLSAAAGYTSYLWSNGDTTQAISVNASGGYTVAGYDSNGCRNLSDTMAVTVHALPDPTITPSGAPTICEGDTLMLSAPAGNAGYFWSTGEFTRSIAVATPGLYSVAVVDSFGCRAASDTVQVSVNARPAKPILSAFGPTEFCQGDSVVLAAQGGYASYLWSTGETTQQISVGASGRYAVVGRDTNGCGTTSDSMGVTVHPTPLPVVAANGPTTFCDGDSVQLSAPKGFVSYLWSTGEATPSIMVGASGDFTVSVTDTNGCFGTSAPLTVVANALPVPTLTLDNNTTLCAGDSVTISAPTGFRSYNWSNGDTTSSIVARQSGDYFVAVSDTNGCRKISDTVSVVVHTLPVSPNISASGPTEFCIGGSVRLDAPIGYPGYLWSTGDTTQTITVGASGEYTVTVSDTNGCRNISKAMVVTVHSLPMLSLSGPDRVCRDQAALFTVIPEGGVVYDWSVEGVRSTILAGQHAAQMKLRWLDSGMATVRVLARNTTTGCTSEKSFGVVVGEPFQARITGESRICSGDSSVLDAGAGYFRYLWSTGDTTQTIQIHDGGVYTVEVENAGGCTSHAALRIDAIHGAPHPIIEVSGSMRSIGDTVVLTAKPLNMTQYIWYRNGELMPDATSAFFTAHEDGLYRVVVTDSNGCHGRAEAQIALPNPAVTGVSLPHVEAGPGDTITVPLSVDYMTNVDTTQIRTYNATIRFNKSLLMPVDTTPRGIIDGEDRLMNVQGFHAGGAGVLLNMRFLSMLGNTESADLIIESFSWDDPSIAVEKIDGTFFSTKLCHQGGTRLFNATGRMALEQNRPNPTHGLTEIIYETRESGRVRLVLADMLGRTVATIVDEDAEVGRYQVVFDAKDLPSGVYLCRLEAPGGILSRIVEIRD